MEIGRHIWLHDTCTMGCSRQWSHCLLGVRVLSLVKLNTLVLPMTWSTRTLDDLTAVESPSRTGTLGTNLKDHIWFASFALITWWRSSKTAEGLEQCWGHPGVITETGGTQRGALFFRWMEGYFVLFHVTSCHFMLISCNLLFFQACSNHFKPSFFAPREIAKWCKRM